MTELPIITLRPGREDPCRRFHPWIFSGAVGRMDDGISRGDVVELRSSGGEFLAIGHYQGGSIAAKVLSFERAMPDRDFWRGKILSALRMREGLGIAAAAGDNAFRLVNAEGDGLPGLVVDVYGSTAVIQAHSHGMHRTRELISGIISELLPGRIRSVYDKSSESMSSYSGAESHDGLLYGEVTETSFSENGFRFLVDIPGGQKTGFFLDQRENRLISSGFAAGRRVLNAFCYTGAFSVYALGSGASAVDSVDSSARSVELAEKNIALNGLDGSRHRSFVIDAKRFLSEADAGYDLIILDPPAFAKRHDQRHRAVMAYKYVNGRAMKIISGGGIIFTFSCSQVIDRDLFYSTVMSAAIEAGRSVRIIKRLFQSSDHPVSAFHPEGEYLKGLALYVE
ncbi:MAG: class I SAM-dependent rRNA methyltransferase [Spirochaetes bacterium]|jgi:23S rRNA (cytosine1962-C5)-methyltransferase|nr:class I SAM-dependent rRNA methyltransferase [Spirochaetota bacterium]